MLLKDKIHIERIPLPTSYPIGDIYSYLILEDPITVVDVGVYTPEMKRIWEENLKKHGLTFKDIKRIYITHGHSDHYGFSRVFSDLSGAKIFLHPNDFDKVKNRREYYLRAVPFLRMFGVPEDYVAHFVNVIAWESLLCKDLTEDYLIPVSDEEKLEFDGFSLSIFHVPGHSPGHTILMFEDEALTGDFIFTSLTPDPIIDVTPSGLRMKSMVSYCKSLKKMERLGLRVFYPAHREFVGEYAVALKNLMERFKNKSRLILDCIKAKKEVTPFELALSIYPEMNKSHIFIVMSEIIGRLDILEEKGEVVCNKKNGLLFYSVS